MSSSSNLTSALNKFIQAKTKGVKKNADKHIQKALDKLGRETRDKIRAYISEWYGSYSPKNYKRTHDLWESVTYTVSGHTVRVFFDMRVLRGETVNKGKGWQPHRSFSTTDENGGYDAGIDFTTGLINWIETGEGDGGSPKNPRKNDGGIYMIARTREWLDGYLDKETRRIIGEVLKESGLAK